MSLSTPDQFRAARQRHTRTLPNGGSICLVAPTLAQVQQLKDSQDGELALADLARQLIVADDGTPVFATAAQAAEILDIEQLRIISDFIGEISDAAAARKN